MDVLKQTQGIVDIDRDFEDGKPEVKVSILRENAQRVGVSVKEIASVLASAYSSDSAVSYFEDNGRQFDITVRYNDDYRKSLERSGKSSKYAMRKAISWHLRDF